MALTQEICGFEGGDLTGVNSIGSGSVLTAAARSGTYGYRAAPAGTNNFGVQVGKGITGFGSGTIHAALAQFFYRMPAAPSVNNSMFWGYADNMWMSVNTNMTAVMHVAGIGDTTAITLPSPSASLWYRVRLHQWTTGTGFGSDPTRFGPWDKAFEVIVDGFGIDNMLTFHTSVGIVGRNLGFTVITPLTLGSLPAAGGANTTWSIDFDDCIYVAATTLTDVTAFPKWHLSTALHLISSFVADQIQPILINGQGTHDDFIPAGDYADINEVPKGAGQITSNVLGAITSYTDTPLSGVPDGVEAYTFRANVTASPTATHALLRDAVETAVSMDLTTGASDKLSPFATTIIDTPLITPAVFNAYQFGVKNNNGSSTITVKNLYIEVLAGVPYPSPTGAITIAATPTYSLDGSGLAIDLSLADPLSVTGLTLTSAEGAGVVLSVPVTLGATPGAPRSPTTWALQRFDARLDLEENL